MPLYYGQIVLIVESLAFVFDDSISPVVVQGGCFICLIFGRVSTMGNAILKASRYHFINSL
jgi:hypothetical protein